MEKENVDTLSNIIRECAYKLHRYLRHGHLEKIYLNGLVHRLHKENVKLEQQASLPVYDEDGELLGNLFADLLVEDEIVVELKAVTRTTNDHVSQLLGYLRSSGKKYGLLINFGSPTLYIKRYVLDPV